VTDEVPKTPSSPAPAAAPSSPQPAAPDAASAPAPAATQPAAPAAPAAAPARPDWLPENFHDAKTGPKWDDFGKHYAEVITRDAAEQIRRNALPANADDYKIDLPKDFVVPQGVEFKFDDANPALANARALYHDIQTGKLSGQEGFSKLLGLYAAEQVTQRQNFGAWAKAEQDKLGPNGPARVTAIEQYLTGKLGPATAKLMMAGIAASGQVEGWEKLIAGGVSQGAAPFSQAHRDAPSDGKISGYENMTFEQRRFAKDQQRAAARRAANVR